MINQNPGKILYVPPRGIGDIVFSMPLLHSLKLAYPDAELFVPVPRDKVEAIGLAGFLKRTETFLPKPSDDQLARERHRASVNGNTAEKYRLEKLIFEKYLAGQQYDLVLITKNFHIDSIRAGLQISEKDILERGIPCGKHMVERFLSFADYLGIEKQIDFTLDIDKSIAPVLTSGFSVDSSKPYVVINLGASLDDKVWVTQKYQAVANWCLNHGLNVILVGDKSAYQRSQKIAGIGTRIYNTVLPEGYSFDLKNYAVLAARSFAVIGPDSGLLHIADAAGARVIGLYGPTSPEKYAPYHNRDSVISRFNDCKNIERITAEEVIRVMERLQDEH